MDSSTDQDQLIRATAANDTIRVVGLISSQTVNEARIRHKLSYVATVALGRAITAGLLLAANLKVARSRISLQLRGDGPLGRVWVDAGGDGTVRGYVDHPEVELPLTPDGKLNVGQAVGRYGYLHVIRDEGFGIPYSSSVELVSGEIGDDITRFLANSEQTPSIVLLGVWIHTRGVQAAGGVLIQVLPDAAPDLIPALEQQFADVEEISPLLAQGYSLKEIMETLLGDLDLKFLPGTQAVKFKCQCDVARVKRALRMLGQAELIDMIQKDDGAEATCHFCGNVYRISGSELKDIVEEMTKTEP